MSLEGNKATVRRLYDLTNGGNIASTSSLFDPRAMFHVPGQASALDLKAYIQQYEDFLKAFPDGKNTIDNLIAEGDYVVARITFRGTNRGALPLMGINSPTNKQVVLPSVSIARLSPDGKIVETWAEWDSLSMMVQLGLMKAPVAATH
jgi:predicted ester cyclase